MTSVFQNNSSRMKSLYLLDGSILSSCPHTSQSGSVTNLSSENNLPTFPLNAPVVIMAKVKEV